MLAFNSPHEPQKLRVLWFQTGINWKAQCQLNVQVELDNRIDLSQQKKPGLLSMFKTARSSNQYSQGLFYAESDQRHLNLSLQNLNTANPKNHFNKVLFTKM